ncbi:MAG TPA: DUF2459 domain-containing protein [Sphingorhabdus sp.]|uniref:DUF2459 domain-containing protein n=1 Tax=Sphingorhabdus sp. TaxID=1902408 RepID=UPI002CA569FA|nr:DUF2459 domain-containing protein [Sphingorhabdus sp.]HMT41186.1 DUF2459 domain-containing protein [Sphingorhabdus sp.]HMU21252.1 DUF2459 domain-containing protein [Sphingorhabdus sp.]
MKLFRINSVGTALRALISWPLLVIGLYFLAAFAGSSIPVNSDWREPDQGIPVFVETNGVHVSLIVPMSAAGEDFSDLIRPEHLSDSNIYGTHAMIGWGHGRVYRNARTWGDVKSGDIASAIIGSDETTLHIYHVIDPRPASHRKRFLVSQQAYKSIIASIRSTFRLTTGGRSKAYPAYGANNLFYDSKGHYSAYTTCNEWTGAVLRKAGIRMGIWTPMPGGVMRWFD